MARIGRVWIRGSAAVLLTVVLVCFARPASTESAFAWTQIGLASFYGPGFNGEETASGRVFDQREMVAAHRTLPFGSVVRVTNLRNGSSAVLQIVDRGPYGRNVRKGAIIDVSKGAAHRLRFVRRGLVRVRVDVLKRGDNARER